MPQQPMSSYPEDHQLPTEISGRSSATFWDIRKIISSLSRYLENNQLLTEISGRSSATNWDIRKIISYLLRYPEYQHPAYWDNWNINSATVLPKCLECLNSPFRGIRKIISYLLRYPENNQLLTEISGRSSATCWDIWNINIPPTEISGIIIAFFQDLLNA